jgi:hypothetical protein
LILTAAIDADRIERMLPSMLIASVLAAVPPAGEMPAIGVIEVYGARHVVEQQILQALQIKVGEWTDLNKSSLALAALTEARDPILMEDPRARALSSLIEMARWKSHGHARSGIRRTRPPRWPAP